MQEQQNNMKANETLNSEINQIQYFPEEQSSSLPQKNNKY